MNDDDISSDDGVIAETIAAVDFLASKRLQPGLRFWDAVEEAVRWWIDARHNQPGYQVPWNDPDPLRTALTQLLATQPTAGSIDGHELGEVVNAALPDWLDRISDEHNDGVRFGAAIAADRPGLDR